MSYQWGRFVVLLALLALLAVVAVNLWLVTK